MMRRVRGLMIIVRVLAPVLLVLGLALATWLTARSVVDSTQTYGEDLAVQLDEINRAVSEANEGLTAIGGFVVATTDAANSLSESIAGLADAVSVDLPSVQIPAFTIPVIDLDIELPEFRLGTGELRIPIPGVEPLKDLAGELAEAGRNITDPIAKVATLAEVPPHLREAADATVAYAGEVRTTMAGWLRAVLLILGAAAVVLVWAQARPIVADVRRGFALMRGRPAGSAPTVVALQRQLDDLQRQIAALR